MSTIIRALILGVMHDVDCVKETLAGLNASYTIRGENFVLANGVTIERDGSGLKLSYSDLQAGPFLEAFTKAYRLTVESKLEALRLEEAKLREEAALRGMAESEREAEVKRLRAERERLEAVRRREAEAMHQVCDEKAQRIHEVAKARGFTIHESVQGRQRVLVLVRRL